MIPKILRPKRKLLIICKYPVLFAVFCLIVFWIRQTQHEVLSERTYEEHQQQIHAAPAINDGGLQKFKEIQNKIIEDLGVESSNDIVQPVVKKLHKPVVPQRPIFKDPKVNIYDLEIAADLRKQEKNLGKGGKAVKLVGKELEKAEEIMKKEAFNLLVSDRIPYNRTLVDMRDPMCKGLTYDTILPSASVIIIFTNEAWSPLIRTIWSVINRSPAKYLKEILLIDDFSDRLELQGKLERYIEKELPPIVRLVRLKERQGLIRARLAGAREATGDVIIFLDSHCEVCIYSISF